MWEFKSLLIIKCVKTCNISIHIWLTHLASRGFVIGEVSRVVACRLEDPWFNQMVHLGHTHMLNFQILMSVLTVLSVTVTLWLSVVIVLEASLVVVVKVRNIPLYLRNYIVFLAVSFQQINWESFSTWN